MTRSRTIAAAVIGSAEMRAALKHLAWNPGVRVTRIVARCLRPAARIFRNAARLRRVSVMLSRIPVRRPFPDIADHVAQAIAVGRECSDRRGAFEAIGRKILVRKISLPGVGHVLAARKLLVAPGEFRAVQSAACGEFPFGLGGQFLAGPSGVGFAVPIGDVDDGMVIVPADVAARTVRPPAICYNLELPPLYTD